MCIRDRLETANPALKSSKVVTGYLEGSNVQVADEMVNLIAVSYTHLDVYKRQTYRSDRNG